MFNVELQRADSKVETLLLAELGLAVCAMAQVSLERGAFALVQLTRQVPRQEHARFGVAIVGKANDPSHGHAHNQFASARFM